MYKRKLCAAAAAALGIMIALAVPGFILKRKNMLPDKAVAALVAVLIYVSQPFMTIDSFLEKDYQPQLLSGMGISFVFPAYNL